MSETVSAIAAMYCDGGVCGQNPSPIGGSYAWCLVDEAGNRIVASAVAVRPRDVGMPTVSNNLTEMLAAVNGLRQLPKGWSGDCYSDSLITIRRLRGGKRWRNVPDWLREQANAAIARLGVLRWTLLSGHPSHEELAAGIGRGGRPVSKHNVWCDRECRRAAWALRTFATKGQEAS